MKINILNTKHQIHIQLRFVPICLSQNHHRYHTRSLHLSSPYCHLNSSNSSQDDPLLPSSQVQLSEPLDSSSLMNSPRYSYPNHSYLSENASYPYLKHSYLSENSFYSYFSKNSSNYSSNVENSSRPHPHHLSPLPCSFHIDYNQKPLGLLIKKQ